MFAKLKKNKISTMKFAKIINQANFKRKESTALYDFGSQINAAAPNNAAILPPKPDCLIEILPL